MPSYNYLPKRTRANQLIDKYGDNIVITDFDNNTVKTTGVFAELTKEDLPNDDFEKRVMNVFIEANSKVLKSPPQVGYFIERGKGASFQEWIIEQVAEIKPGPTTITYKARGATRHVGQRHLITIQQFSEAVNDYGSVEYTYSTLAEVYANIKADTQQGETVKVEQLDNQTQYFFYIDYRTDVLADYRIKYGDRYFKITAIYDDDGRQKFLTIEATETVEGASGTL